MSGGDDADADANAFAAAAAAAAAGDDDDVDDDDDDDDDDADDDADDDDDDDDDEEEEEESDDDDADHYDDGDGDERYISICPYHIYVHFFQVYTSEYVPTPTSLSQRNATRSQPQPWLGGLNEIQIGRTNTRAFQISYKNNTGLGLGPLEQILLLGSMAFKRDQGP